MIGGLVRPQASMTSRPVLKPYDPALMEAYAVNASSTALRTTRKYALSQWKTDAI